MANNGLGTKPRLGFIGLGGMGSRMAQREAQGDEDFSAVIRTAQELAGLMERVGTEAAA